MSLQYHLTRMVKNAIFPILFIYLMILDIFAFDTGEIEVHPLLVVDKFEHIAERVAIVNYCDTFSYMLEFINDKQRVNFYLARIKSKYIQYHQIYEENGKYGILDHTGKVILKAQYDFLRTPYVYVDDLRTMPIIAQKDGKMGLVLPDRKDTIYADFIYDDITLREEPPYFEAVKDGKVTLL